MVRYIVAILGLLLVVGTLVGIKTAQISSLIQAGEAFAKAGPPPEAVSIDVARDLSWEGTLSAVGSIAAARGVAVSNDAPGVVKKIHFESGAIAKPGQALVELDTSVERAQLTTAQARLKLATQTLTRTRSLHASGGVSQSQLDNDESQVEAASADVAALKAQIERKVVRAAFAGKLGIREVNLGQYLSPGTTLTTLEALDSVYVDFTLPQQALHSLQPGQKVRIDVEAERQGADGLVTEGAIAAIDPSLNAATRSIKVRATISNTDQKLRPGMYANVSVVLPKGENIVAVPTMAVLHAPYGDSVFLVEPPNEKDGKGVRTVRQQFVKLGEERGDFVAVLDGVKANQELVVSGAFKLRNGAKIVINNKTKPNPQVDPKVENR